MPTAVSIDLRAGRSGPVRRYILEPTRASWGRRLVKLKAIVLLTPLMLLIWGLAAQERSSRVDDYLRPDLRKRVEELKVQAHGRSSDSTVLSARLETLWEWANAYSLTGGPIPGGFPQLASNANRGLRQLAPGRAQIPVPLVSAFIAQYTREFQIKDENPEAIGRLTLSSNGPYRAGEFVTVSETYEVGDMPMAAGGGIAVGQGRSSRLQTSDPQAANFVSVRTSNPGARFVPSEPWGTWATFETRNTIAFRLAGADLAKGDTVTLTFGDRSGGSPGLRLQNWSNDRVVFKTFLDLEANGWLLTPEWPALEVIGEERIRFVNAIAPSVVEPGQEFTLHVRSEDRYKNLASGSTSALEVQVAGETVRRIPAGSGAMYRLDGISLDSPGVYRFDVRSGDGALQGTSNPVRVERDPRHRIFWGETHGHTGFAEGQGSPDGYFKFGRDIARLDFLSLSEHDIWMDDFEWKTLQEMVEKYRVPGKFTTILGFEWTSRLAYGGHHNVFFRDTPGRLRVPNQKAPLLDELYQGLRSGNDAEDVLVVPHAHQPGDWTNSDGSMGRLVEIQSGHGTFDWFGNKYLENGYRVGFVGASDNHVGHPGYSGMTNRQMGGLAAVLASRNTPDAIFDGLRNRATYATTGERIVLTAELNGAGMGQEQDHAPNRTIRCTVNGTAPVDAIDVIKNGAIVYTKRYLGTEVSADARVQVSFEASTEVIGTRQVPRGDRSWKGVIRVEGAEITGFDEPWFRHPATYSARLEGGRVHFAMHTRGRSTALVLRLRGASADTQVVVDMDTTTERRGSGGYERTPQRLPANTQTFRLGELNGEVARREYKVLEHTDALSVQLVPSNGALDQDFTYTDRDEPAPGDYYYLRVRQMDGAVAWSSPFWMGERSGAD